MLQTDLQEGLAAGERASHLPTGRQYHLQAQLSQRESGIVRFLLFFISLTNFCHIADLSTVPLQLPGPVPAGRYHIDKR
jgi:hypothetical protein